MTWPNLARTNPPPPVVAAEVLTDIITICDAKLAANVNPPTPAQHRSLYMQIRAHAVACMVNGPHGLHRSLIDPMGNGNNGPSDIDTAITHLTKCLDKLLLSPPTAPDLLLGLHEIDHSAPGGGVVNAMKKTATNPAPKGKGV